MKTFTTLFFLLTLCIGSLRAHGDAADSIPSKWQVNLSFDEDFYVNGYVKVRENQYTGDRLSLHDDFGVKSLSSLSMELGYSFRNKSVLQVSFDNFFFSGHSVLNRNIWFNGTNLAGSDGLSSKHTQLIRLQISWENPFQLSSGLQVSSIIGLIYDALIFRIDGVVLPGSYRNEPYEKFVRQALPYPQVGFKMKKDFSSASCIWFEATGTFIPLFKSFFTEGGKMSLHYYTLNGNLGYQYSLKHFFIYPSVQFRAFRIYEESNEDTNDFFMKTAGIRLKMGFMF